MRNHGLLFSIPALLLTGALLSGDSLTVQLTGVSVSDGTDYVLPYGLTINGVQADGICYSVLNLISMNQIWQANVYNVDDAATNGEFAPSLSGYETVAYLSSFWYTGSITTTDEQIDLQHAIWDVFAPGLYTIPGSDTLVTDAVANESTAINDFDYSNYSFLEAIPDQTGYQAQPFVLYTPGHRENTTPEPGSWLLLVIGGLMIGFAKTRLVGVG